MSAKFTPGPWVAYCQDVTGTERLFGDDGVRFWDISAAGPYRGGVACVHAARNIGGISLEERDANARLIASTPDLLEAVQNLMGLFDNAIYRRRLQADTLYTDAINQARAALAKATTA